ncbi:uncharacterized protein C22orf46 homolog [Theropithecus gelada]|uniref:uncharacterized protein C22orf46 homolog n=1 Tax=Theropithecus gelada TaxID=9565 RepID=UPI000DC1AB39|nr:uncharacterized protein C22orf46 homolog [Theropithecus gelada]
MLLSLLGACAVVGPFHGPEWEPVQGLLSQDHSCRDPQCCGNLLVLCLFLVWQVRHYWHQVTRTRFSTRNVIKVPLQKRAVPSMRCETVFELTPEFFSPGKSRGLGSQQWAQRQRWGYRRSLQESWAQNLLSLQHPCPSPPSGVHTYSQPIFCTTSISNTCLLPQDSSWKAWQVPWCLRDGQTRPALDMCQEMEQLLLHSQERLVSLESVISMRSHPNSMTLTTSLPNLLSAQRLQFCPRELLSDPSHQTLRMCTWKSWDCPPEAWESGGKNQTAGREDSRQTQAARWMNQTGSRREDASEIQASGEQFPVDFGMEGDAETKVLECANQRLVISETDGEILTPGWDNQDQMGVESRTNIQELGNRNQREAGGKNPPETQAHMGENQEQLRCKMDAETQTPEWENQDKNGSEDAVETQTFERKDKKQAGGEDGEEIQAQGLGKQGQTGDENGEETQTPQWEKQDQMKGEANVEIQTEEGRNKDRVGGQNAAQTQSCGKKNVGEVKKENSVETQALDWGKQECIGNGNVTEIQTPKWEKHDQGGSKKAKKTQVSGGENQKQLSHEIQVWWGNKGLRIGEDAKETQIATKKQLREIREKDWVIIQALWWGNQRQVASEIDREFEILCWENQNWIGGEHRAESQASEKRDQRKDGDEVGTNILAPKAEIEEQLKGGTDVETQRNEPLREEDGTYIQSLGRREVKDEDDKKTQELGGKNQGKLGNEFSGNIHIPKAKNQEHIRGKDGAHTQTCESGNWGKLTSQIDGETHSAEWKKDEQIGGENGTEIQIQGKRNLREVGGEDGVKTWAPGKETQSQFRSDIGRKILLSEWKSQQQMGSENGTEIQAPVERNQREPGGEDGVKTQRSKRENEDQLDGEIGGSHSPGRRNWELTGKNVAENQASEKRNQREIGNKDGRMIWMLRGKNWRLRAKNQRLLKSKGNGKTSLSERKNQEQGGGGNDEEIQIQGKRNLRGTTSDDGTETQAPAGDDQGQLRGEIDKEIQVQGQRNKNEGGVEDVAELQDIGSQRKCTDEDVGEPQAPRGGNKDLVRGEDAVRDSLQVDCSGNERPTGRKHSLPWPPAFTGYGLGTLEQEQAVAVNGFISAPCPETNPFPHRGEVFLLVDGEGEHLASQGTTPARDHRVGISPASQQAQPETWRRRQRDKGVDPEKAPSLTRQPQNPLSLTAPLGMPSACPCLPCGPAPEPAIALEGAPTALTILPKGTGLKKSKRLLLESLMRRRIAHLKWGLPRRILESYFLFNFLGSCSLTLAGARLPGLNTGQQLQAQQERYCEAQGSSPGLKSPERFQRVLRPDRKSSKLPTQARALESNRLHRSEPMGISIQPERAMRVRPPGGARELQEIQEAPARTKLQDPRIPRPAADSRSWCGLQRVEEPPNENSRGRKMIRSRVSQVAERAPSRMRTSSSRADLAHWKKECISWEPSKPPKPPRLKCQQPTYRRRGSLESTGCRGAGQQPSYHCAEPVSFKGRLHSAVAKLSLTLLNKMSWSPQLTKCQHLAPNLSLREPDSTLLPKVDDPRAGEDSIGDHTASQRDLQPRGHCCTGATLPKTESPQGQGAPGNPNGAPQNTPASKKFSIMKHLSFFLFQHGFKKQTQAQSPQDTSEKL